MVFNEDGLAETKIFKNISLGVGGDISNLFHTVGYDIHILFHVGFAALVVELLTSFFEFPRICEYFLLGEVHREGQDFFNIVEGGVAKINL